MIKIRGAIFGAEEFKQKLNAYSELKNKQVGTALSQAALLIKRDAQLRVPVEYGVLKNSARSRLYRRKKYRSWAEVKFTAAYALYVHENTREAWKGRPRASGKGAYWGPRGESKFLEKAWRLNIPALRQTMRRIMSAG